MFIGFKKNILILLTLSLIKISYATNSIDYKDITIVGSGISGLYSAYRLSEAYPNAKISIYEKDSRVGGQILSYRHDGNYIDVGAMRFYESQKNIYGLVTKELSLNTESFNNDLNKIYLRDKHFASIQDFKENYKDVYNSSNQFDINIVDDVNHTIKSHIFTSKEDVNKSFLIDHIFHKQYLGMELYKWSYNNLISTMFSSEEIELITDISGYSTEFPRSLYSMIYSFHQVSNNAITISGGMEELVSTLIQKLKQRGVNIYMNEKLISIYKQGNNVGLVFENQNDYAKKDIVSSNVILALPKEAIRHIFEKSNISTNENISKMFDSIILLPVSKIGLFYDSCPFSEGHSITNNNIKNIYVGKCKNNKQSIIASYVPAFEQNIIYWESYFSNPSFINNVPEAMQSDINKNLANILETDDIPSPSKSIFVDWRKNETGVHAWRSGVDILKVNNDIKKPVTGLNIYIVGESFSLNHGWIEGAINDADVVLDKYFGLSQPNWIQ